MFWSLQLARRLAVLCLCATALGGGCDVTVEEGPGPGPGPGPVAPDRATTCGNFDEFTLDCTPECGVTWDCDLAYDDLDVLDQIALDTCSDCLVANLDAGICADCEVPEEGIDSCQFFMENLLGVDCW